jgi:hypothetical protein
MDRLLTILIRLARATAVLNILTASGDALCTILYHLPSGLTLELKKVLMALLINKKLATLEANTAENLH